jgi:hypothetical protein
LPVGTSSDHLPPSWVTAVWDPASPFAVIVTPSNASVHPPAHTTLSTRPESMTLRRAKFALEVPDTLTVLTLLHVLAPSAQNPSGAVTL